MSHTSQKRGLKNYCKRPNQHRLSRFDVLGLDTDRVLIRCLAKQLAAGGSDATRIRLAVSRTISGGAV